MSNYFLLKIIFLSYNECILTKVSPTLCSSILPTTGLVHQIHSTSTSSEKSRSPRKKQDKPNTIKKYKHTHIEAGQGNPTGIKDSQEQAKTDKPTPSLSSPQNTKVT